MAISAYYFLISRCWHYQIPIKYAKNEVRPITIWNVEYQRGSTDQFKRDTIFKIVIWLELQLTFTSTNKTKYCVCLLIRPYIYDIFGLNKKKATPHILNILLPIKRMLVRTHRRQISIGMEQKYGTNSVSRFNRC